ncbi:MAG: inositol monophosphatase family protein [Candidatus Natronoplasma sp.]
MEKKILEHFKRCAEKVEEVLEDEKVVEEKGKDMGIGADGTPTKGIDAAAESAAIDYLTAETDLSILSEEKGIVKQENNGLVIMDPVDGTRNALLDIPMYCISLAFTPSDFQGVEVGYVKNLVTGTEYHAIKGEGSFKDDVPLSPDAGREDRIFSVYLGKKAHEDSYRVASQARRVRALGSAALEICLVAEGVFDLYHHRSPEEKRGLRITDLAAAALVLREVGGEVYDKEFEKLDMGLKPDERKDVIAIYDDRIKEEVQWD